MGGAGVIGMNCTLLAAGNDAILLDCGAMFPGPTENGVDVLVPDLDALEPWRDRLRGIVITHGHEDHIGALPWVLRRFDLPVYAGRFAMGLIAHKLTEHGLSKLTSLHLLRPNTALELGCLAVTPLRVTHSIPDACSLAIDTPEGKVLFTGDFKIDRSAPGGVAFDEAGFRRLGEQGVELMLSDSTNATVAGWSRSEGEVAEALREVIGEAPGRVLVGLFSSNVFRIQSVLNAAKAAGRRVALVGRSVHRYVDVAQSHGGFSTRGVTVLDGASLGNGASADDLVLICTGSQAEPRGALRRIAEGQHGCIRPRPGDTLVMSSRRIPGNERAIFSMLDDFTRAGVRVIDGSARPEIHASGHGAADELSALISWVKPKRFVPLHGTWSFMRRHAELARAQGVEQTLVVESGQALRLQEDELWVDSEQGAAPWYAAGGHVGDADVMGVRDRLELSYHGVVALCARHDGHRWQVQARCRGVWSGDEAIFDRLEEELEIALRAQGDRVGDDEVEETLRIQARRFFKRRTGQRPIVMSFVLRARG